MTRAGAFVNGEWLSPSLRLHKNPDPLRSSCVSYTQYHRKFVLYALPALMRFLCIVYAWVGQTFENAAAHAHKIPNSQEFCNV